MHRLARTTAALVLALGLGATSTAAAAPQRGGGQARPVKLGTPPPPPLEATISCTGFQACVDLAVFCGQVKGTFHDKSVGSDPNNSAGECTV